MSACSSINPSELCGPCKRGLHDCMTATCQCHECNEDIDQPVLVWEDPIGGRGRKAICPATTEQIEALRGRPLAWARIKEYDKPSTAGSTAGRIKKGAYPELRAGEWEAAGRRDGGGSIPYLRFTGEKP